MNSSHGHTPAKQLVFSAPHTVGYEDLVLPAPETLEPTQVLVHTTTSGISHGTEMSVFLGRDTQLERVPGAHRVFVPRGEDAPDQFPFRYAGYEAVGRVLAVGRDVSAFGVGDRVWAPMTHQNRFVFDLSDERVQRLPEHVADEQAVFIHLILVALNAVMDAEVKTGDVVGVIGGGTVGQMAARIALLDGASRVYLVEPMAERRALAERESGITAIDPATGNAALSIYEANQSVAPDVVIECSGSVPGLQTAISACGVGGTVIAAGAYPGSCEALRLGEEFLINRVTMKASMAVWGCPSRFPGWNLGRLLRECVRLLAEQKLDLTGFEPSVYPFAQAQQAYNAIRDEPAQHIKCVLRYD